MYIVCDRQQGFIQWGSNDLKTLEDFLREGLIYDPVTETFSSYRSRVLAFQRSSKLSLKFKKASVRFSIRFLAELFFNNPKYAIFASKTTTYALWDLESETITAQLPCIIATDWSALTDGTCVRINKDRDHSLYSIREVFQFNDRRCMVVESLKPCQQRRISGLTVFAIITLILLSIFALHIKNSLALNLPNAHVISEAHAPSSFPIVEEQPKTNHHETHETEKIPQPTSNPSQDTQQTPHEFKSQLQNESAKKRLRKKVGPHVSEPQPRDCKPIVSQHESKLISRLMQKKPNQGEWYVCR